MPAMVAKRRGLCAACSLPIEMGEVITYKRGRAASHGLLRERCDSSAESVRNSL